MKKGKDYLALILIVAALGIHNKSFGLADEFTQVAGIFDVHTNFSDGAHSLESLIKLAEKRRLNVLFINDHACIVLEYGLRPLQNILRKRVEKTSIMTQGAENYLDMIKSESKKYPELILIPGAEVSPFYYWRGHYLKKNLTVCDWERHLLIIGAEDPEDYKKLPILHNGLSTQYIFSLSSAWFFLLFIPIVVSLFMLKKKGIVRYSGIAVFVFSLLLLVNNHPFKSSPYDQYHGPQGISPYQLLIDYVNSRGGMIFWNHPETNSGRGKLGPIFKETLPCPQVLIESRDYTGFAALYGEGITITEPGNIWDKVLKEYCQGQRAKPVWGISTADFHREGESGEKLGSYSTIFLVKNKKKEEILDSLRKGRFYAYRGNIDSSRLILENFSIQDPEASQRSVMGEEIFSRGYPRISIRINISGLEKRDPLTVRLIRFGDLVGTFSGEAPLNIEFKDEFFSPGKKIYYRLDARDKNGRIVVSNPVFVKFQPLN